MRFFDVAPGSLSRHTKTLSEIRYLTPEKRVVIAWPFRGMLFLSFRLTKGSRHSDPYWPPAPRLTREGEMMVGVNYANYAYVCPLKALNPSRAFQGP